MAGRWLRKQRALGLDPEDPDVQMAQAVTREMRRRDAAGTRALHAATCTSIPCRH